MQIAFISWGAGIGADLANEKINGPLPKQETLDLNKMLSELMGNSVYELPPKEKNLTRPEHGNPLPSGGGWIVPDTLVSFLP